MIKKSKYGNLNLAGHPNLPTKLQKYYGYSSKAPTVNPSDPDFYQYVEPKIQGLVRTLISSGLTTVSSCEGHSYDFTSAVSQATVTFMYNSVAEKWFIRLVNDFNNDYPTQPQPLVSLTKCSDISALSDTTKVHPLLTITFNTSPNNREKLDKDIAEFEVYLGTRITRKLIERFKKIN